MNQIINDVVYIFLLITYLRHKKRLFEAIKAPMDYGTPSSRSKIAILSPINFIKYHFGTMFPIKDKVQYSLQV